jgi:hypothetical protein
MTCDTSCGTFFMNGREYYNISGKSYDGHNPICPYRATINKPCDAPLITPPKQFFNT